MTSSETLILNSIKYSRAICEAIDDFAHTSDLALLSSMGIDLLVNQNQIHLKNTISVPDALTLSQVLKSWKVQFV